MWRALLLSVALLGFAGCGGDDHPTPVSKEQYEAHVSKVGQLLVEIDGETLHNSNAIALSQSEAARSRALDAYSHVASARQQSVLAFADELAGIAPPNDVAATNTKLIDGLRATADHLDTLAQQLGDGSIHDDESLQAAIQEFYESRGTVLINEVLFELTRLGYPYTTGTTG